MTIAQKLIQLKQLKDQLKTALVSKGVTVPNNEKFINYANHIRGLNSTYTQYYSETPASTGAAELLRIKDALVDAINSKGNALTQSSAFSLIIDLVNGISTTIQQIMDPYFDNVVLLMHMNSPDYMTDVKNHEVRSFGTPQFGSGAGKFSGGLNYATGGVYLPYSADWDLGNQDFTIEAWFHNSIVVTGGNYAYSLFQRWYSGGIADNRNSFILFFHPGINGALSALVSDGSSAYTYVGGSVPPSINTWHHAAFCRKGNFLYLFLDGVQIGVTTAFSGTIPNNTSYPIVIGGYNTGSSMLSPSNYGYGNNSAAVTLDEVRITKGVARYTSNFSVPDKEFYNEVLQYDPYWSKVVSLVPLRTNTLDVKSNTTTVIGSSSMSYEKQKFLTQSLKNVSGGGLKLNLPQAISTLDFTAECWINPTQLDPTYGSAIFDTRPTGVNAVGAFIFFVTNTGRIQINKSTSGTSALNIAASADGVIQSNNWYHVAVSRSSGIITIFVNGVQVAQGNSTDDFNFTELKIGLNAFYVTAPNTSLIGFIQDVRVTRGVGRYTANFIMPTLACPKQ